MLSAICFNLDQSKILSSGNEVKSEESLVNPLPNKSELYWTQGGCWKSSLEKQKI